MTAVIVTVDSFVVLLVFGCWVAGSLLEWVIQRSRDNNHWRQAYYREHEAHLATLNKWSASTREWIDAERDQS
jgi:hypothetical protein